MKVLAVIPARAGSRGVPNKNIRLLNDKPLISYSIDNALGSKYITDVIVTTDSETIKSIALQKGVCVRDRDEVLCGDSVTLDAVVYDAQKDGEWDYVVTMQPTSPTLTVETLDSAISFAIENDYDTIISAINRPHLAWTVSSGNGEIIPAYKERLNRQYLPPHYEETGAFVISKSKFVTQKSRLGEKIGVFEIPENEAIDIDTFNDLRIAESILSGRSVAIFVNGNNQIGLGHIYRVLELADEFYCKPDIIYDCTVTDVAVFGETKHNLIPVEGVEGLFSYLKDKSYQIFINDILSTDFLYMARLKKALPTAKLVNIEDDGEGTKIADLVINALYEQSVHDNTYCGEAYYITPKLFLFYSPINIKKKVKRVFICFGGADPQNYTNKYLEIISSKEYSDYHFVVVLGKAKADASLLMKTSYPNNIEIYYDVKNMPELMTSCDVAITSRGRTAYELALLGIPTISLAQNEREALHGFVSSKNGFEYLGLIPSLSVMKRSLDGYLSMSQEGRISIQKQLLGHNLRKGRGRVMHLIRSL